jgi:aminoglycoside phosphotransferase (APT) family kinase protein
MDRSDHAAAAIPNADRLRTWLFAVLDGLPDSPLEMDVISGGQSNVTLALRIGTRELVLRRPPVGAFLPSANDMSREYTFLSALASTSIPTPQPICLCEDADVVGAPFYLMERLHGIVPHDSTALDGLSEPEGRCLSEHVVDLLVDLHGVDPDAVGLGQVAKRTGYLERQVRRWVDQYHRSKDGIDDPAVDALAAILLRSLPTSPPSTIVHGDYRLGNLMLDSQDRTRVIGVFDWEMATLGDPLADVGYSLLFWGARDRPPIHPSQACADLPGFLTAAQFADRYATGSGRPVDDLTFHVVLAAFKLSIIGLGQRAVRRRAGTELPDDGSRGSLLLAEWALELWRAS